jgi:hypothetical protein
MLDLGHEDLGLRRSRSARRLRLFFKAHGHGRLPCRPGLFHSQLLRGGAGRDVAGREADPCGRELVARARRRDGGESRSLPGRSACIRASECTGARSHRGVLPRSGLRASASLQLVTPGQPRRALSGHHEGGAQARLPPLSRRHRSQQRAHRRVSSPRGGSQPRAGDPRH